MTEQTTEQVTEIDEEYFWGDEYRRWLDEIEYQEFLKWWYSEWCQA